ncbi:DNA primase small subunit [Trypanosoma cruzi]|nr:DNA primase small subunit [Trypanosoma cruzi]
MHQSPGAQNTARCGKADDCKCSANCAGGSSPAVCSMRSHLKAAASHEVIVNQDTHSESSQECEWPSSMVIDDEPGVVVEAERASLPLVRNDKSSSSGKAGKEGMAQSVLSSRKEVVPSAPLPMFASALPFGSSCEEKTGSPADGEEEVRCWLPGGISGSLPRATLTPSEHVEEVWTGARHRDPGELVHSSTTNASGYNTSEDAHSQTERNRVGLSLELQQLFATGAAAQTQPKHAGIGGDFPATVSDNNSSRGSIGAAVKRGAKNVVKGTELLMEDVNGMNALRPTNRKTPANANSRRLSLPSSPRKAYLSRDMFAVSQERAYETSIAKAGSFIYRNQFSHQFKSAGNTGQTDESNRCELNGFSPALNCFVDGKKKDKNEGTNVSGVAADGANSSSCVHARQATPKRHPSTGNAKSVLPLPSIDSPRDVAQSGSNNPGRPGAGAPALASQQLQQSSALAKNTQKLVSPAIGSSHWPFLPTPEFVSSLQIYVNTCLGLCESDMQARHNFITRVQRVVTKVLGPHAEVRVHGSITTDLALASSDIDLLVVGYEPLTPLQAIQQLSRAILHISEDELQVLESGETGENSAGVAGEGSSHVFGEVSSGVADEGVLDEKGATIPSVAELEDVTLGPGGELDAGDPIMRMEEEEAEYRSQIERDYLLSTRAGITSAAMVNSLPSQGPKKAAMALQGYMGPFAATPLQPPLLRSLVENGIVADLSMPIHHQPNAGGHRLYVPTLEGPYFQVQTIVSTRVPVIKVTEKATEMRGDITFAGGEHWRSMQLTNRLLKRYPASRGLILFLKHCVRQMGIGDSQPGGVTSFAIYLMVLHFFNEISRHLEGILQQQQKKQQEREDRDNVVTNSGNEGTTVTSSGTGDGVTSGAHISGTSTPTPGAPMPLASLKATAVSLPAPQQRSRFDDRFSLVEMMLLQRVHPYHEEKGGKQNTASILHYIRTFLEEEEVSVSGDEGGKDRAADLIKERTGAKLVAPLDYDAVSGELASYGQVQQKADVVFAACEALEVPGLTLEQGENDVNIDDHDGGDDQKVVAELNHVAEGKNSDGGGSGCLQEKEGDETEDAADSKASMLRSLALRLLSTSSLGHLFHDFCFYYGFTFDYDNHGLYFDPLGNSSVVPKPRKCQQRGQHLYMTSPFDDQYDITARMLHTREFQELCRMFVPLTTPLATISGYGGGGCTLQEVLEWISPETAFGELMQVHAAIQQQQHQQRADVVGTQFSKNEEKAMVPSNLSEGSGGTSLAQPPLRCEVERRDVKSSSPHPTFNSGVEGNLPKDTRLTRRRDTILQKASGSITSNELRKKDDRTTLESNSDLPSAMASLTPSSGGLILTQPGSKTISTEHGTAEMTGGWPANTPSMQRQMKRREGGAEESAVVASGGGAAAAASGTLSSSQPVVAEAAMLPLTPAGASVAPGSLTGSGAPVGGEAVYARAQHSRSNPMQHQHQHQQVPFSFPPPIPMFFVPPNGAGAGYPDPSQLYFPMPYPPEAMLHYYHHNHHYQNHNYMMPFPYLGYEMNQFYQQSAVFDALNAAAGGGGGGNGAGGGPTTNRQGNTRGAGLPSPGGRQRARGGAHRGGNSDSVNPGEKVAPGRPASVALLEEPTAAAEGMAVDGVNSNNNNTSKNTMMAVLPEGPSTRERQPGVTDVKERLHSEDSSFLAQEVQQHQQFLQHQQQLQQLHQFSLSHQYHQQQNGLKLRSGGQQHQQAFWGHHPHASLMMQHQMYALQSSVDNSVSNALCASIHGGAVFRQQQQNQQHQQQNTSGAAYPVSATPFGLSRMPTHDIPTSNLAVPIANEGQQQQKHREQISTAAHRSEGAAANSGSSSGSSSASRNARGGGTGRPHHRGQGEDFGEGRVAEIASTEATHGKNNRPM